MHVPLQVNNEVMSSSYSINAANTSFAQDNGMYTCRVTLTVAGEDNFTATSNSATVGLRGTDHKFEFVHIFTFLHIPYNRYS